ncbi:MAG: helix-turn-helix domain-containing protein, partial [Pseudoruminococcus massiliensis]
MSVFSERLKDCRKRCGFTQRELANKLGVASSAVGMYEQGR